MSNSALDMVNPASETTKEVSKAMENNNNNENGTTAIKSNGDTSNPTNQNQVKNRIQVSNTKKPLFFYLNLAKRYLKQHNEVELSALGMAIPTVVIIAEILKRNGVAKDQKVMISTVGNNDESTGRIVRKARIEIILERTKNADASDN